MRPSVFVSQPVSPCSFCASRAALSLTLLRPPARPQHSQSDWYTPAYGPLLRLESPTGHAGLVDFATEYPPAACPHERSALLRSNWLMSRRFGARKRVPLAHIPKVQSTALLLESAEIWKADFSVSSGRRFREVEEGETADSRVGDLHAVWLGALLLVERSREAMRESCNLAPGPNAPLADHALTTFSARPLLPVWTWAVARMGGLDGTWGDAERQEIATLLGFDLAKAPRSVAVEAFDREARPTVSEATLHSNLGEMGLPTPEVSEVLFCAFSLLVHRLSPPAREADPVQLPRTTSLQRASTGPSQAAATRPRHARSTSPSASAPSGRRRPARRPPPPAF